MSVKLLLPILFSLCLNGGTIAQDSSCVSKRFKQIRHIIEEVISNQEGSYANKLTEFFVIDIKISDSTGSIEDIDYFKKNNSIHYKEIFKAVEKIKEDWKPLHCGVKRLLIPIYILFDDPIDFDYPFIIQKQKERGVFVNELIIIPVSSKKI
jgi:hypothetical protein